jgi:hypothetical protein
MVKDWFAEFKGKTRLSEREVKLMKKRIHAGRFPTSRMRTSGYALSGVHIEKGIKWLRKHWKELTRLQLLLIGANPETISQSIPNKYRRRVVKPDWKSMDATNIRLVGFAEKFYPIYQVTRKGHTGSFRYYAKSGKVSISSIGRK